MDEIDTLTAQIIGWQRVQRTTKSRRAQRRCQTYIDRLAAQLVLEMTTRLTGESQ